MKTNIVHQIQMRRVRYNHNEGFVLIQNLKDYENKIENRFSKRDFDLEDHYFIPIIICSSLETFFRSAIKELVDKNAIERKKLIQIDAIRNFHFDINTWAEFKEKEISIGELAQELIKLNGIKSINSLLSILLDLNFLSSLTSFPHSTKSNHVINAEEYWSNNYQQVFKDIDKVYEIRNIIGHEFGFWIETNKETLIRYLKHCILFLERVDRFFEYLKNPPKRKSRKMKEETAARKSFIQKDKELDQLIKKILEAFDELGYDTEPSEEDFKNEMILWKQYRKKLAKSNCEKYLDVTNFKYMYWLNMERITDEKIDSLFKQNESLFFEVEINSKVQRFD